LAEALDANTTININVVLCAHCNVSVTGQWSGFALFFLALFMAKAPFAIGLPSWPKHTPGTSVPTHACARIGEHHASLHNEH